MLVVHPASLCDVCLDPYSISSEPANSPHVIACGHIFCLTCLRNLSPSACPLCRKTFQPDRLKKLHVAGPPELDGVPEALIEVEATQLLQRVALASGEDVPDVEIIEVVTHVEEWLSTNSADEYPHRPLRAALTTLQRYKALQERNERDYAEYRRARRELKAYRRNAHQDSKTSRAVEESLLGRIDEIESNHALLSRLHAEIDSLRSDPQQQQHYCNASNPLPLPPEPLPLDRFPAFARPGGAADTPDPLLSAVPYPAPPPRTQPTSAATITNGHSPVTAYSGTSHTQFVPPVLISQPLAAPRARHAEAPRGEERNRRPTTQAVNGNHHPKEDRRRHAESSRARAGEARYGSTDGRPQIDTGPGQGRRVVVAPSPAPSWAHHPLVEGGRSDEEREVRPRGARTNGTNGLINGSSDVDSRLTVDARLASAEAYVQGYGFGYDSGFQIASEPPTFTPSSYGSDRSDRVHAFPVEESPDQPIGGLGLMGVPHPIAGTVSTPDEEATPVNRTMRLTRRNTTQVDVERSARRLGDQPHLDMPQNGGSRRGPLQTIGQVLGVRRAVTEGALRHGVNGADDPARQRRAVSGVVAPLAGEDESPRSETTWGTVQTLSGDSISGGSMGSLGLLLGLHNGGVRGQGSVTGDSYGGRGDVDENVTSEGEDDETETPMITGSLPGSESVVSGLGLIREDEGEHSGSNTTSHRRVASYTERNPSSLETTQDRQARRARRSEGSNGHPHHALQSSITEVLRSADIGRVVTSNITSANALSLHFDASFPTHDYQAPSTPSGLEIVAPTPIVGGPNIIHLWANRT
ncbi:hypothetical protein EV363DRAFT_1216234 [Boletus edulis]|nr:hypothetical protein EV363DRAFT_1216234 [Boletus edulis]